MASMTAREFVKKAASDAEFRRSLGIVDGMSLSQLQEAAAAAGHQFPEAELRAATARELSDADLDSVSGGYGQYSIRQRGIKT